MRIGREFFLILSGRVAVTQKGRRVNALGPGDFFGELAAMNPGPRNATVTALSDLDVLIIGPREFAAMGNIQGFRDTLPQEHGEPPPRHGRAPGGGHRPAGSARANPIRPIGDVTFGPSSTART